MYNKVKIMLIASITAISVSSMSQAAMTKYGITVSECNFDFDGEKFCSDSRLKNYAKVLKTRQPNFDKNKIIYIFETNDLNYVGDKPYRLVVIDISTKTVHPFDYNLIPTNGSDGMSEERVKGKPVIFDFNVNSGRFCFSGRIDAYKMQDSSEPNRPLCFNYSEADKELLKEY